MVKSKEVKKNLKDLDYASFNDNWQREAIIHNMIYGDSRFRNLILEYCNIEKTKDSIVIKNNPIEYEVDLVIEQNGKIKALLEVDYYERWDDIWPDKYKWCNILVSKLKYLGMVLDEQGKNQNPENLPYITATINKKGNKAMVATCELIKKHKDNIKNIHTKDAYGNSIGMQKFIQIPPKEAYQFGEWTESELIKLRVI